jgi:phenylpyruvate tautomerase PptA (4-oxalocrotonate tautomerase family)
MSEMRWSELNEHQNQKEHSMPVVFIEAPPGIRTEAKKKMVERITTAIDDAYHIGDTLIFLREYPPDNVTVDGRLQSENPKILEILQKISS